MVPNILSEESLANEQRQGGDPCRPQESYFFIIHTRRLPMKTTCYQLRIEAVFTDAKFVIYDPEFHKRRHFHRDLYFV